MGQVGVPQAPVGSWHEGDLTSLLAPDLPHRQQVCGTILLSLEH